MTKIHEIISSRIKRVGPERRITLNLNSVKIGEGEDRLLHDIPKEVFDFKELESLQIEGHRLKEIPPEISNLPNLRRLDLGSNRIRHISQEIKNLEHLMHLDLHTNSINDFPVELLQVPSLKHLDLTGNRTKAVPEEIRHLSNLQTLRLSRVLHIPQSIHFLVKLKELLVMSSDNVELYLDFISNLESLVTLWLPGNKMTRFPESLKNLHNLVVLILNNNRLGFVPDFIATFQNLERLDLRKNPISTLPKNIYRLKKLKHLELGDCLFEQIPKIIYKMKSLSSISFANVTPPRNLFEDSSAQNRIKEISPEILKLPNLKKFKLDANPIDQPPPEIIKKGLEAIKNYFRQVEEQGEEKLYEAKLLIVGEGGAGKTSLANKIINPNYELREEDSTMGIEILKWKFPIENKKEFNANIWDFGGQEIYHRTHQFFLTKRSLYVLVADNRKEDTDFHYWLSIVNLLSEESPLLIVNNEKYSRQRKIGEKQLRGEFVSLKETLPVNLANNKGLSEVINKIKYYIQGLPHIGTSLPKSWVKVREALDSDPRSHIRLDQYLELCEKNKFVSLTDKLQLSGYLHDLGVCLHFQNDPLLKRTVILKPKWGTDAVYKVLDNEQVISNLGKFSQKELKEIWSDSEYVEMQDELLRLMINFKLCYQIPNSEYYIAPQLLSDNEPEYQWNEKDNLILRYDYEFMPKGILNQLVVALHKLILNQKFVWKSGVLLEKNETLAEVIEHYAKKHIKIRLEGEQKRDLMTIITHEIDKIHDTYRNLRLTKLIPCNCIKCGGSQDPHFYSYEILRRFISDREEKIQCLKSYKLVFVRELIDDTADTKKTSDFDAFERNQIFISYSHQDKEWLNRLKQMLKPLVRENAISIWDDTQIHAGAKWKAEITKALKSTKVAILLVSPSFLASDFIAEQEFPHILQAAEQEGLTIFWVAVSDSLFSRTAINEYQCANNPKQPLDSLPQAELNKVLVDISEKLLAVIS